MGSCCVQLPTMPLSCCVSDGSVLPLLLVYTSSSKQGKRIPLACTPVDSWTPVILLFITRTEARRRDEDEDAKASIAPKP